VCVLLREIKINPLRKGGVAGDIITGCPVSNDYHISKKRGMLREKGPSKFIFTFGILSTGRY